jgi:hypothetical protein
MSPAIERLREAVQANCNVTDARHARGMTLCTYLLEMRELYRWECRAPLTAPLPRAEVGAWIAAREALWETLDCAEYRPLPVDGGEVDPWDVESANRAIASLGLVYGAGIGRFGKPQFFLGVLEREEWREGMRILVVGRELARDLAPAPAAMRGETAAIRLESLARLVWERVEAWALKRPDGPLKSALDAHGYVIGDAAAVERIAALEAETLILHELGEREAGRSLGPGWEAMLAGLASRRAELFARAARDHLADCLVTLPTLLERGAAASIHLWFASLDGMRRLLFPRALRAYAAWCTGDGGRELSETAAQGASHWRNVCSQALGLSGLPATDAERALDALVVDATTRL